MPNPLKYGSPRLELAITPESWEEAVQADSGGCLIADAIKRQYPHLSGVRVDMATVRVTDRKKGLRFTYLTPEAGQELLLSFDQGWRQPTEEITVARAVRVTKVTSSKTRTAEREAKIVALEEKRAAGPLTRTEKASLRRLKNSKSRPSSVGPVSANANHVVHGGTAPKQGAAHPNLLRGRSRVYGAKRAKPAEVFQQAVEQAVSERLAELEAG